MAKEDVLFKSWLDEVKADLQSDEDRAAFEKFATGGAGKNIFKGYLREKDYHRERTEVDKKEKQLVAKETELQHRFNEVDEWYALNKPQVDKLKDQNTDLLKELEKAKAELADTDFGDRGFEKKSAVVDNLEKRLSEQLERNKSLEERVVRMDNNFPQVLGKFLEVTHVINKEGYDVSPLDVLNHSLSKRQDPLASLNELTADVREKREQEKWTKELEKAKEEGRREERKNHVASPDRLQQSNPFFDSIRKVQEPLDKQARRSNAVGIFLEDEAV